MTTPALLGAPVPAPAAQVASPACDAGLTGHFDLFLGVSPPATQGGRILVDVNDDFCEQFLTGKQIVPGNLNDFGGGPYLTDDPGWFMDPGQLLAQESLHFRALGRLRFWDIARGQWTTQVPNGEHVRLFGGVPLDVFLASRDDPSLLLPYESGTIFTVNGIQGPVEAGVDLADASGGIHTHLDFCLQDGTGDCAQRRFGTPAQGAYLIELQFFSPAQAGGQRKYRDSPAVLVALANGLDTAQFQEALDALSAPPRAQSTLQTRLPGAGVLLLSGQE
ncbi:MAG: hypothetical protein KDK91_19090 [Gammaproteobacteria bacterium]|nr:hypothetical protein [Gammaproteobacteria bacterium]